MRPFNEEGANGTMDDVSRNHSQVIPSEPSQFDNDSYVFYSYPESGLLLDFTNALHRYFTPVIIALGVSTNLLSFVVFVGTHLRLQSSSVFLAALAISDSIFLLATTFNWLSWVGIHVVQESYLCHVVIYISYCSAFLSVAIVVGFTVERYIIVCYPFQRQILCTVERARTVVIVETVVAITLYSYIIWTTELKEISGHYMCDHNNKFLKLTRVMTLLDSVLTFIVPSVIIIILNTWITFAIYRFLKNRWTLDRHMVERQSAASASVRSMRLASSSTSSSRSSGRPPSTGRQLMVVSAGHQAMPPTPTNSRHMKTTRMLLIVSGIFVTLNLPSHAIRFRQLILAYFLESRPSDLEYRIGELLEVVYYMNFATNFFIYSLCARSFRAATHRVIHRLGHVIIRALSRCQHKLRCCRYTSRGNMIELHENRHSVKSAAPV